MTTLYKLTDQMQELSNVLADCENMEQAITDTMEGLELEFNQKAENILFLTRNLDSGITALDDEIKRLQARKKVISNKQDSLKEYLRSNMDKLDINKIECPLFSITLKKAGKIVIIDDINELPAGLKVATTTITCNKNDVKKALIDGQKVDGAHLEDGKRALMIK